MNVREVNKFKSILYHEIIKNEEIKEKLKTNDILYVISLSEGNKHIIKILEKITHLNKQLLIENGFSINAHIEKLYTIDKQRKLCY